MGVSGWILFDRIRGFSRFTCLLLGVFALLDLCVMDSFSSNALPVETPPAQNPFSQLAAFAQQLRSSGPPLGLVVQAASTNMETSLSRTESGRVQVTGKFNFVVSTDGVDSGPEGPQVGEAECSLFYPGIESPSDSTSEEV